MHRRPLLQKLRHYTPCDVRERHMVDRTIAFVQTHPDCFERSLALGHITASAWLIDSQAARVLLTHHRQLGKWLQVGGHADGDPDVLGVALREAREESGLEDIQPLDENIFDVDIHRIPTIDGVDAHLHYDVRFLLQAQRDEPLRVTNESTALAWVPYDRVTRLQTDQSVERMQKKWQGRWELRRGAWRSR